MGLTLADLVNRVSQKLDENVAFYTPEIITLDGINPAMRLLAYSRPNLLTRRATTTVNADFSLLDLRTIAPRHWRLRRVVLGTITGDSPSISGTQYHELLPMTLDKLQWRRDWFIRRNEVRNYWLWGDHWLGLYPRPIESTTVTLIFRALPLAFTVNDLTTNPSPESELPDTYHPLITDLAFALLILKEGAGEVDKAQAILSQTFGQELTKGLRRLVRQSSTLSVPAESV